MIRFEHHEYEPPSWQSVELVALRPTGDAAAAELRRSLPLLVGGVVAEIPGAELRLGMFTDVDGMVGIDLAASAGDATPALMDELTDMLASVAETAVGAERMTSESLAWPIIPDGNRALLGFIADAGPEFVNAATVAWHPAVETACEPTQLIEDLACLPGHGLQVQLRSSGLGGQPGWVAQLAVLTVGTAPALRLRAGIRRRFTGLRIAESTSAAPVWLRVGPSELPAILPLPVAGSEPLRGTYAGPAAAIPVRPPRSAGAPDAGTLRIGAATTAGGRRVAVRLTLPERLRHVHVVGQTGTGKSSALAGLVAELVRGDGGALVADPHGHLCDRIVAELPEEVRDRVWVIRCGDTDNPVPMNPLAERDPVRRDIAIADVCGTFQYLFDKNETGIVGPRFVERVAMTLRALHAVHGVRASLLDVPVATGDDDFMSRAVKRSTDDRLKAWWRTNALESRSNEHGQVLAWVNSKFETFSSTTAMRGILGSGADAIDFAVAMDDGRIILLDLSKAELGQVASRLLGYLYLNRVWHGALRRQRPERPFTVIVDEAHTLISGALTNMLAEGRKFGLSVVLAHQFLDQLDADLRPAVDGNIATTIAFRSAAGDAVALTKRFGGLVEPSALVTLPDLSAVCLRTATPGAAYPHTLMIDHNARSVARVGAELDAHAEELRRATCTDLVDPYRSVTAAAAAGASNVKTLNPSEAPKRPERAASGDAGDRPAGERASRDTSFLDEWLARAQRAPAPASSDSGGVVVDDIGI